MHLFNVINKVVEQIKPKKEQIKEKNTKIALGYYNMKDLENDDKFIIKEDVNLNQIDNLKYTKESALIEFTFRPAFIEKDELIF